MFWPRDLGWRWRDSHTFVSSLTTFTFVGCHFARGILNSSVILNDKLEKSVVTMSTKIWMWVSDMLYMLPITIEMYYTVRCKMWSALLIKAIVYLLRIISQEFTMAQNLFSLREPTEERLTFFNNFAFVWYRCGIINSFKFFNVQL